MKREKLRAARETRVKTLAMVSDLTQVELDRSSSGRWTVGQLLDHLHRSDLMYGREIEKLINLQKQGKPPVLTVSLSEMEFSVPGVPRFLLPFADIPVSLFNYFLPNQFRELFLRSAVIRAESPPVLRPVSGRGKEELFGNLERSLSDLERLFIGNLEIDFTKLRYYHPLFGFNDAYDILGLMTSHEQRHQKQLQGLVRELEAQREPHPSEVAAATT